MTQFERCLPLKAFSLSSEHKFRSYERFLSVIRGEIRRQNFTQKQIASELQMDDANFSKFLSGFLNIDSRRLFVLLTLLDIEKLPGWQYETCPVDSDELFPDDLPF